MYGAENANHTYTLRDVVSGEDIVTGLYIDRIMDQYNDRRAYAGIEVIDEMTKTVVHTFYV